MIRFPLFLFGLPLGGVAAELGRCATPNLPPGYVSPMQSFPAARAASWNVIDLLVLAAVLGLGAWLVLKVRRRRWIAGLMAFSFFYFGVLKGGCVCPVGAVDNVTRAFFDDGFPLSLSVVVLFMAPLLTALFFGRIFCGAACPLGAVQDLVLVKGLKIPEPVEKALRIGAYLSLGLVLFYAATGGLLLLCRYDPFVVCFWREGFSRMWVLGGGALLLSLFVGRPFCRFLCPYGILLRAVGRLSRARVSIAPADCNNCGLCAQACPFGAIKRPAPEPMPAEKQRARRRLRVLLLTMPAAVAAGVCVGLWFDAAFGRLHPVSQQMHRPAAAKAAETPGRKMEPSRRLTALGPSAAQARDAAPVRTEVTNEWIHRGGGILGGALMLIGWLKLVAECIHWRRGTHEADRAGCFACGRCFAICPFEQERRAGRAAFRNAIGP